MASIEINRAVTAIFDDDGITVRALRAEREAVDRDAEGAPVAYRHLGTRRGLTISEIAAAFPAQAELLAQIATLQEEKEALVKECEELKARPLNPLAVDAGPSFLARNLVALFTADDYAAISAATAASPAIGLLWASFLAQGDAPIRFDSERFQAGWAGLTNTLGDKRTAELAKSIGFSAPDKTAV